MNRSSHICYCSANEGVRRQASRYESPLASVLIAVAAILIGLAIPAGAFAQETEVRLIDVAPFDLLRLRDVDGKMKNIKIEPLEKRPALGKPTRVVVIEPEVNEAEREITWRNTQDYIYMSHIDLIIDELDRFLAAKDLDKAFGNLLYLRQNYPKTPQLEATYIRYLYADVLRLGQSKQFDAAMSTADELYTRDPNYKPPGGGRPIRDVMAFIISQTADQVIAEKNYIRAREYLADIETKYRDVFKDVVAASRKDLSDQAIAKQKEAIQHLKAGRFREARAAGRRMIAIYPEVEGSAKLMAEIVSRYKLIVVGVTQPSIKSDPRSLHNWAERRTGAVAHRLLCEFQEQGPDGGRYSSPVAALEVTEDRDGISFDLSKATTGVSATAYEASQRLGSAASPQSREYSTAWAQLLEQSSISGPNKIEAAFRRPHVLPQALLQLPLAAPKNQNGELVYPQDGAYIVASRDEEKLKFAINPNYNIDLGAQKFELEELVFDDSRTALDALRRGDIDLIDRLHPGEAAELIESKDSGLIVGRYDLPTVHMLIPNQRNEHMKSRTFRRALMYGIDREQILLRRLLRNLEPPSGCQVISGPFPAGIQGNESLGYAYNDSLQPRPYEPRLALTLGELAQREIASVAKLRNIEVAKRPVLKLAHPATETAREACVAIAGQLGSIGFTCELKELPHGETLDSSGDYDLLYAEIAMWEPLVDAGRLFGPGGIVPDAGPYVSLALRRLESASEWDQARRRLTDLHRMTFTDMTVIPLWQLTEHFAFHRSLRGVERQRLTLYNDVEKWQVTPIVK